MRRSCASALITALTLTVAACGSPVATGAGGQGDRGCPITIPSGDFTPPDGYPLAWTDARPDQPTGEALADANAWYGSAELWTVLPVDGEYQYRKSVWWSTAFPGGIVEEHPAITVTWTRLDDPAADPIVTTGGTNAYTPQDGWLMIGGIDPIGPGCWRVEAEYKGATLSYVYELD